MHYKTRPTSDEAWRQYIDGTKTVEEVAEHFGVQITTARTRASMLGLPLKRKEPRFFRDYPGIKEYAVTHTAKEVAEHYGMRLTTVYTMFNSYGIKYKRQTTSKGVARAVQHRTGEAQDMIITLCDFYSQASVARVFGYSKERVRQIYNEAKAKEKINDGN